MEALDDHLRRTLERALDSGHGCDREATLRASGTSGQGLQSGQARASFAGVSLLFSGGHAHRAGDRSAARESDRIAIRAAWIMELAGQTTPLAMAAAVARRCELGDRAHDARSRAARVAVSVQIEAKPQRKKTYRAAFRTSRVGKRPLATGKVCTANCD